MYTIPGQQPQIQINFPPNMMGGVYSNNVVIAHSKEEFIMDFIMMGPPQGVVNARVIMSPGHMKRLIAALQDNIKKYENNFGKIEVADEPKTQMGFQH